MKYRVIDGKVTVVNDCVMLNSVIRVFYFKHLYVEFQFWCAILDEPIFNNERSMVELLRNSFELDIAVTSDALLSSQEFILSLNREELFYHTKKFLYNEIQEKTVDLELLF